MLRIYCSRFRAEKRRVIRSVARTKSASIDLSFFAMLLALAGEMVSTEHHLAQGIWQPFLYQIHSFLDAPVTGMRLVLPKGKKVATIPVVTIP